MAILKLDFDGRIPREFLFRLRHCAKLWRLTIEHLRYDKTRRGWHVLVTVTEPLSPALIVAAQAILGSDRKREAFNLMRVQSRRRGFWGERWNVLYARHSRGVKLGT